MKTLLKRSLLTLFLMGMFLMLINDVVDPATAVRGTVNQKKSSNVESSISASSTIGISGEVKARSGPGVFDRVRAKLHEVKPPVRVGREAVGYYAEDWKGDTRSLKAVQAYGQHMSAIAPFAYVVDKHGNIKGEISDATLKTARDKNLKVLVLIHNYSNGGFDRNAVSNILNTSAARKNLINNIHKLIKDKKLAGVNIDLENIDPKDRQQYNLFLKELKEKLQTDGYLLTVSIPAKTHDDKKNAWSGAFDYAYIGSVADRVMLMTYDEHWVGGGAGPVASLPWVEKVVKYAVTQISKDKVLLGIGTYGYDWSLQKGKNRALPVSQIPGLAKQHKATIQWDDKAKVPYFYYWNNGEKRVVWYESTSSAALKAQLVKKYDIRGIAVWRLGFEDSSFWETMSKNLAK